MLIWRIETTCGKGFYRNGGIVPSAISDAYQQVSGSHPSPWYDLIRRTKYTYLGDRMDYDHIFGFTSIKTARKWFHRKGDLKKLSMCNLVAYDQFTRLKETPRQCIFIPEDKSRKAIFPPSHLHTLSAYQLCREARNQLKDLS